MTRSGCPPSNTPSAPEPTRGRPPRQNIVRYRAQLRRLGFGHDQRRSVATTDPEFFRWTQWIFTQLFEAWYDETSSRARPISALVEEFEAGTRPTPDGRAVGRADPRRAASGAGRIPAGLHRLGAGELVPGLGTVLSNEEVTPEGRSAIGNYPGVPAEPAAVDDADHRLRRPAAGRPGPAGLARSVKAMQRNWIGRSYGARLELPDHRRGRAARRPCRSRSRDRGLHHPARTPCSARPTWCWRRSTRWWTSSPRRAGRRAPIRGGPAARQTPVEAVAGYRREASMKSDLDRQENKEKTGVFTGAYAVNPANGARATRFYCRLRADGLRHRRDHGRARAGRQGLGLRHRVRLADHPHGAAAGRSPRRRGLHR